MARCEGCIHEKVCLHRSNIQSETYAYMGVKYDTERCKNFISAADVVPKSEVEKLEAYIDDLNDSKEHLVVMLEEAKTDVAREIFEDIENNYADFLFDGYRNIVVLTEKDFAELKKKYTEVNNEH